MKPKQPKIKTLLEPLFKRCEEKMVPANEKQINYFKKKSTEKKVPKRAIEQLIEFYKISNGVPCLDSSDFHSCDDKIIFEWWSNKELWLGQRDSDTIRWKENKFCLGDASNVSYGKEYEFDFLSDLLEKALKEWGY